MKLLILACSFAFSVIPPLQAGNFYNADNTDGIFSGDNVNVGKSVGIAKSPQQATLIHPQVAITATRGKGRSSMEAGDQILFGSGKYKISKKIELTETLGKLRNMFLLFLDRPVDDVIPRPIAKITQLMEDTYLHYFSHNPNIQIDNEKSAANPKGDLAYGRMQVDSFDPQSPQQKLSIGRTDAGPGNGDFVLPTPDDVGSPAFIRTRDEELALAGIMSDADSQSKTPSYTPLYPFQADIEDVISQELGESHTLESVESDEFEAKPPRLSDTTMNLLPMDFSPKNYMKLYPDLKKAYGGLKTGVRELKLAEHFLKRGKKEGRVAISSLFNPQLYLSLWKDLKKAAASPKVIDKELWALNHYKKHGKDKEKRHYIPKDFDAETYMQLHKDVNKAGKKHLDRNKFALKHYVNYGFREKRAYKFENLFERVQEGLTGSLAPLFVTPYAVKVASILKGGRTDIDLIPFIKEVVTLKHWASTEAERLRGEADELSWTGGSPEIDERKEELEEEAAQLSQEEAFLPTEIIEDIASLSQEGTAPEELRLFMLTLLDITDEDVTPEHLKIARRFTPGEEDNFTSLIARFLSGLEEKNEKYLSAENIKWAIRYYTDLVETLEITNNIQKLLLLNEILELAVAMEGKEELSTENWDGIQPLLGGLPTWQMVQGLHGMYTLPTETERNEFALAAQRFGDIIEQTGASHAASYETRKDVINMLFSAARQGQLSPENVAKALRETRDDPLLAAGLLSAGIVSDDNLLQKFARLRKKEDKVAFVRTAKNFTKLIRKGKLGNEEKQQLNDQLLEAAKKGFLTEESVEAARTLAIKLSSSKVSPLIIAEYLNLPSPKKDQFNKVSEIFAETVNRASEEERPSIFQYLMEATKQGQFTPTKAEEALYASNGNPLIAAQMLTLPDGNTKKAFAETAVHFSTLIAESPFPVPNEDRLTTLEELLIAARKGYLDLKVGNRALALSEQSPLVAAKLLSLGIPSDGKLSDKFWELRNDLDGMLKPSLEREEILTVVANAVTKGEPLLPGTLASAVELTQNLDPPDRLLYLGGLLRIDSEWGQIQYVEALQQMLGKGSASDHKSLLRVFSDPNVAKRLTPRFTEVLESLFSSEDMDKLVSSTNPTLKSVFDELQELPDNRLTERMIGKMRDQSTWQEQLESIREQQKSYNRIRDLKRREEELERLSKTLRDLPDQPSKPKPKKPLKPPKPAHVTKSDVPSGTRKKEFVWPPE